MESSDKHPGHARGEIFLKRAYEPAEPSDGFRVLVDRLWPRGLRRHEAQIDLWLKEIAPSAELRRWFGHDPARWKTFQQKYRQELLDREDLLVVIEEALREGAVTLLFAARDVTRNNAIVVKKVLEERAASDR